MNFCEEILKRIKNYVITKTNSGYILPEQTTIIKKLR